MYQQNKIVTQKLIINYKKKLKSFLSIIIN